MGPNLVDEGGEAVVEGLDLLLLLGADSLDGGVNIQVQRGQQAPVDLDSCDRWSDHRALAIASAIAKTTRVAKCRRTIVTTSTGAETTNAASGYGVGSTWSCKGPPAAAAAAAAAVVYDGVCLPHHVCSGEGSQL